MTPKFQFRISDLLCVMLIVGALPTLAAPKYDHHRLLIFILTAALEFPAAVWAVGVLQAWEIKSFLACLALHVYALAAGICLLVFPAVAITLFMTMAFPKHVDRLNKLELLLWLIVSGAGAVSVFVVEKKKRASIESRQRREL